jgi:5-methylcytosine-specific restriction endonuclease McrA
MVGHITRNNAGVCHIDDLQLLCGHCNRVKGNRSQGYLIARLWELGIPA